MQGKLSVIFAFAATIVAAHSAAVEMDEVADEALYNVELGNNHEDNDLDYYGKRAFPDKGALPWDRHVRDHYSLCIAEEEKEFLSNTYKGFEFDPAVIFHKNCVSRSNANAEAINNIPHKCYQKLRSSQECKTRTRNTLVLFRKEGTECFNKHMEVKHRIGCDCHEIFTS